MVSKYKNKKIIYNGFEYDSKMESEFAKFLDSKGIPFTRQPVYIIQGSFEKLGKSYRQITYKADFEANGIVYDVKGMVTETFALKKKLFDFKFKEKKLVCVRKLPNWLSNHTNKYWIDLTENKKLQKILKKFKKTHNIKTMSVKNADDILISQIKSEIGFIDDMIGG